MIVKGLLFYNNELKLLVYFIKNRLNKFPVWIIDIEWIKYRTSNLTPYTGITLNENYEFL